MRMIRYAVFAALMVAGASCGDSNQEDCTGGICPGDGGNGDGGPCVEAWLCSPWDTGGSGNQATRTCSDQNACGTIAGKPIETAALPALDPQFYECNVEPILVQGCAQLGCHGTETGRAFRIYARGRLRITGQIITEPGCLKPGTQHPSEDCIGSIECRCWSVAQLPIERQRSFDSARGFGLDAQGKMLADMAQSEFLRQPETGGGFAHAGIHMWSKGDSDYNTILQWLQGTTLGRTCNSGN